MEKCINELQRGDRVRLVETDDTATITSVEPTRIIECAGDKAFHVEWRHDKTREKGWAIAAGRDVVETA